MAHYEVIIGTEHHMEESLAIAEATLYLSKYVTIEEIHDVHVYGGGEQQIGVGLEVETHETMGAAADLYHVETVEEVSYASKM